MTWQHPKSKQCSCIEGDTQNDMATSQGKEWSCIEGDAQSDMATSQVKAVELYTRRCTE